MKNPRYYCLCVFGALMLGTPGWAEEAKAKKEGGAKESQDVGVAPTAEEQKSYAGLAQRGVLVQPLAAGSNYYYVNFRGAQQPDAALFDFLKQASGIVDLDLAGQKLGDGELKIVGGLKNLRKLNLSRTTVTDGALAGLLGLSKLESLNLFQTEVSDAGVVSLKGLTALKRLYVAQTKVTEGGAAQLKAALPAVSVERGGALVLPPKKEEPKKEEPKKEEPKKEEPKKEEPKKEEPKKEEPKKEPSKPENAAPAKEEPKKEEPKKP